MTRLSQILDAFRIWAAAPAAIAVLLPILSLGAALGPAAVTPPVFGIDCIIIKPDGTLYGLSRQTLDYLVSADGGHTWREATNSDGDANLTCTCTPNYQPWEVVDPQKPLVKFRLTPGSTIERSTDGGKTWLLERDLTLSNAQLDYYQNEMKARTISPGPLEAALYPGSGDLIVAMGFEGILIRSAQGQWRWRAFQMADTGENRLNFANPATLAVALSLEPLLGVLAGFLLIGTLNLMVSDVGRFARLRLLVAIVLWVGWIAAQRLGTTLLGLSSESLILLGCLAALALTWGTLGALQIRAYFSQQPREVWLGAVACAVLYVVPFVLWTQSVIPLRSSAVVWACVLIVAINILTRVILLRRIRAKEGPEELSAGPDPA